MRILFVGAAVDVSISDSSRGYLGAFKRAGHDVHYFNTPARISFAHHGLKHDNPALADSFALCSRIASEGIVVEALRHRADLVIVSSGLALHPDGLELLNRTGLFPTALILTESPYNDKQQAVFAQSVGHVFTNDLWSADQHGWTYLPSAYDPEFHKPYPSAADDECDVLFVGTGWKERIALFEAVDWSGIDLKLMGMWPDLKKRSRLRKFVTEAAISNDETARLYSSAKVTINHHRAHDHAFSLNPRGYELAACEAYQVSDMRPEGIQIFGSDMQFYNAENPEHLGVIIRQAIRHTDMRKELARRQRRRVETGGHTFDDRAAYMLKAITG